MYSDNQVSNYYMACILLMCAPWWAPGAAPCQRMYFEEKLPTEMLHFTGVKLKKEIRSRYAIGGLAQCNICI